MTVGNLVAIGNRVVLVKPTSNDESEFLQMVDNSRRLHGEWISPPSNQNEFDNYIAHLDSPNFFGVFIADKVTMELIGVCNASQIVLGRFRSCYLGFYVNAVHARRGFMLEGMSLLLTHLFTNLELHRAEANIQPNNVASRTLVQRLGFELEGYSKNYLFINGAWKDHERWAIRKEIWTGSKAHYP